MNVEEAKANLKSTDPNTRLRAARFFAANPQEADLDLLRLTLSAETVSWNKKALVRAIETVDVSVVNRQLSSETTEGEAPDRVVRAIMARAAEEVTSTILHEFGTVIGSINLKASLEFENFQHSQTSKLMKKLNDLLKAIRNLKKAAASPTYSEFSLSDLVDEILASDPELFDGITIPIGGVKPFTIEADRGSMLLAVINGLRNASEAVREFSRLTPPEIVINWGRAGNENFLVIIDSGAGFKGNPTDALRIGVSNKPEHTGYGLATAQYAMRAMEGDLLVSNSLEGGARFELRWYRSYEDTAG